MPPIRKSRLHQNYSMVFNDYGDGGWRGAVVTAAGIVLVYSDVHFNHTRLSFVSGGQICEQYIERACTPRGAAIRAGRFVRQVVQAGSSTI